MNKYVISALLLVLLLLILVYSCRKEKVHDYKPIRSDEQKEDKTSSIRYRPDEMIVMYKSAPTPASVSAIKGAVALAGINTDSLKIRRCSNCDGYFELWQAKGIHTVIHAEAIKGGSGGGGSQGVGEDTLARYSLNFIDKLPLERERTLSYKELVRLYGSRDKQVASGAGKDTIIIAVLDTGIDTTSFISSKYLWTNKQEYHSTTEDPDHNCYSGDVRGWNFIDSSANIRDDNDNLHGTLISHYIINEFAASPHNFVQLMSLKTHDSNGYGDLFTSICALHYAADKGANIVNASWGFYYYEDKPHPYMDSLITRVFKQKGILFVTAAGNKIDEIDERAKDIYKDAYGVEIPDSLLRNLEIHNFYPACLSDSVNNVITVTTTDGHKVSPTQNYSSRYVDLGVKADSTMLPYMKFRLPFQGSSEFISGSSFATAIASGKIGAFLPKSEYLPGLNKRNVIEKLELTGGTSGIPVIIYRETQLESNKLISKGRYSRKGE